MLSARPIPRRAVLQGSVLGLVGLGMGSVGLTACSFSEGSGGGSDELVAAIGSDVGSLDPQSLGGTGGGNWPGYETIFGGAALATTDPKTLELLPGVAESWEQSEDHLTWTLRLRPDITFHNGDLMTAEDVKFSMDRNIGQAAYNPDFKAGYSAQFAPIVASAEVIDQFTVRFTLKTPDVVFLRRPLFIVPKAYIEQVGDNGFAEKPVGVGWYKLISYSPGSELRTERWDSYHVGSDSQSGYHPSYVPTLVQKVIPEDQARLAALQAGEVDLVHNLSADIARQLEADENYVVHYLPGSQAMMIDINTDMQVDPTTGAQNPWRDKRVRVAANMAIDLDTIIASILTGKEAPTFGSNSHGIGFPPALPEKRFGYEPDRAKALLAEAGYPDGFETSMFGPTARWPNSRAVMEAVAQYLAGVGIRSSIQELQYQEVTTRVKDKTLGPLVFFGRSGGEDPGLNFRYNYHSTSNFSFGTPTDIAPAGDVTQKIDSLIERSEAEFDEKARRVLLEEIITEYYLSAKSIWLYEPVTVVVTTADWTWDLRASDLATPEYWNIRPA